MTDRIPVVVKMIDEPCHGADGSLLFAPGQTFPADRELPEDARWRWALADPSSPSAPRP